MSIVTIVLTVDTETHELKIAGDPLPLDFALSIVMRAQRILEQQEKFIIAQQMGSVHRDAQQATARTRSILRDIKM